MSINSFIRIQARTLVHVLSEAAFVWHGHSGVMARDCAAHKVWNTSSLTLDLAEKLADPKSSLLWFSSQTALVLEFLVFSVDDERVEEESCSTMSLRPVPVPGNNRCSINILFPPETPLQLSQPWRLVLMPGICYHRCLCPSSPGGGRVSWRHLLKQRAKSIMDTTAELDELMCLRSCT